MKYQENPKKVLKGPYANGSFEIRCNFGQNSVECSGEFYYKKEILKTLFSTGSLK